MSSWVSGFVLVFYNWAVALWMAGAKACWEKTGMGPLQLHTQSQGAWKLLGGAAVKEAGLYGIPDHILLTQMTLEGCAYSFKGLALSSAVPVTHMIIFQALSNWVNKLVCPESSLGCTGRKETEADWMGMFGQVILSADFQPRKYYQYSAKSLENWKLPSIWTDQHAQELLVKS